jgi:hypothetical protein
MTFDHMNDKPELHLQDDPQLAETESLLDMLAQADRDAMPAGLQTRVLDSISSQIAPAPIALTHQQSVSKSKRFWVLRIAAGVALFASLTAVLIGTKPWANTDTPDPFTLQLMSLETDLDAFFELEAVDDGNLTEAVTDWEIWAQSVDTDIDSSEYGFDWTDNLSEDGESS